MCRAYSGTNETMPIRVSINVAYETQRDEEIHIPSL